MANMGLTITILILTFAMSFAIYLGTGNGTMFTHLVGLGTGTGALYSSFYILLTVTAVSSIAVGLFSFPNPYAIFSGITILVLGFFTLPTDLLVSVELPTTIKLFIGGAFGLLYILSVLGWYK